MPLITDWQWLAPYWEIVRGEDFQAAFGFIVVGITVMSSSIAYIQKRKDKRENAPPRLAIAETSWDAATQWQIYPLPNLLKIAPFPFVASDLSTRQKSQRGWFTATELRIWNAGKGIIFGPLVERTSVAEVCVPKTIGAYEVRWTLSNDPEMTIRTGLPTRSSSSTAEDRIPIRFDFMHPGKGILVSIWHNSADGEGIRIRAFSKQTPVAEYGTAYAVNPSIHRFMNRSADLLLVPSSVFAAYMYYVGNTWLTALGAVLAWESIATAYLSRKLVHPPDDLTVSRALPPSGYGVPERRPLSRIAMPRGSVSRSGLRLRRWLRSKNRRFGPPFR